MYLFCRQEDGDGIHLARIQILLMTRRCQRHREHYSYTSVYADSCILGVGAEHLAAVEIMQLKHIIILQNKIDLIDETKAVTQQDAIQVGFCRGIMLWHDTI